MIEGKEGYCEKSEGLELAGCGGGMASFHLNKDAGLGLLRVHNKANERLF